MGWVNSGRYLKNWFEGKSLLQTGIVAARLSIFAVPYVNTPDSIDDKNLLRSFAATALGWLAYGGENRAACAGAAASLCTSRIAHYETSESYAQTYQMNDPIVSIVACAAAYFATTREEQWSNVSGRAIADIRAFSRIEQQFFSGKENFWVSVNLDLDQFEEAFKANHTGMQILTSPVSEQQIDVELWRTFSKKLLARDPNWSVWIDWYEDRLAGRRQNPAFERALLSITKGEWKLPPREVNGLLMERIQEIIPLQADVNEVEVLSGEYAFEALPEIEKLLPASDRLVSVRHNQEPFDRLEKSLDDILDEFSRDHNKRDYVLLQRPKLLESISEVKEQIKKGWVDLGDLRDHLRPELEKLAQDCKSFAIIAGVIYAAVKVALAAIDAIIKVAGFS